jgi:hypothetical protein
MNNFPGTEKMDHYHGELLACQSSQKAAGFSIPNLGDSILSRFEIVADESSFRVG